MGSLVEGCPKAAQNSSGSIQLFACRFFRRVPYKTTCLRQLRFVFGNCRNLRNLLLWSAILAVRLAGENKRDLKRNLWKAGSRSLKFEIRDSPETPSELK